VIHRIPQLITLQNYNFKIIILHFYKKIYIKIYYVHSSNMMMMMMMMMMKRKFV